MEVFGLSRSKTPNRQVKGTYLVADRTSSKAIGEIINVYNIDVVIDVLAMKLPDTQALISELDGHIAQYVMLGSSDVYRNYELLHGLAQGTPTSNSIDEDSALRTTLYTYLKDRHRAAAGSNQYLDEYDKIPIEELVRTLATDWTILRLPMIYGPGDKQRRFSWAIGHMVRSDEPLVMPRVWAEWITTYGYVENVAEGIALTIGNSRALKRVFNIGEVAPVNHLEWSRRIAEVLGWNGDIEISDDPTIEFAQRLSSLDLSVQFQIDSRRIREQLGFYETVTITDGLTRTAVDERVRG